MSYTGACVPTTASFGVPERIFNADHQRNGPNTSPYAKPFGVRIVSLVDFRLFVVICVFVIYTVWRLPPLPAKPTMEQQELAEKYRHLIEPSAGQDITFKKQGDEIIYETESVGDEGDDEEEDEDEDEDEE